MTVTVNNVQVDFHLNPPRIRFLQGADMSVSAIRQNLRAIEASEEGRMQPTLAVLEAGGRLDFSAAGDRTKLSALAVRVLAPYVVDFEAGATPYVTQDGNFLAQTVDSPGAIVRINNAVEALTVATLSGTEYETRAVLSSVLDGSTLRLAAWLVREGQPVMNPTEGTVRFYDVDGSLLHTIDLGTPDARGTFHASQAVSVVANRVYTAEVQITDGVGTRTDRYPQQTLEVS